MVDNTLAFLKNPYGFISEEARKRKSSIFETRLLLRKTICMTGAEAAALFYSPEHFVRKGAAPSPITATLFGKGGLQGLDGVAHRRRKEMHLSLLSDDKVTSLGMLVREIFRLEAVRWLLRDEVSLYEECQKVLTEAVCQWAGIPVEEENISERALDIAAQYDRSGGSPLMHFSARNHRARAEAWMASLIKDVRSGKLIPEPGSPLAVITSFRDHRHQPLDPHTAAVELLNLIRPTVAVSVYIVFVAHALSLFPEQKPDLRSEGSVMNFLQEVRRYYPFFPAVTARVRRNFIWKKQKLRKGERVMLDIFGTNHDPQHWKRPDEFSPARFEEGPSHPFAFIPQGGGDVLKGHRCPGETVAVEVMRQGLHFLVEDIDYLVPAQDLEIDFSRLPAVPKGHFRMKVVELNYLKSVQPGPESYYSDSSYHFSHQ